MATKKRCKNLLVSSHSTVSKNPKNRFPETKAMKAQRKFWLVELENRRLAALTSAIQDDLSAVGLINPAVDRLSERVQKRMQFDNPKLRPEAYTKFMAINAEIEQGEVIINLDPEIKANAALFICSALERFTRSYVEDAIQCNLDLTLLLSNWRYGPGASIGSEETHFADKISQNKVSITERAIPLYKLLRRLNPHVACNDIMLEVMLEEVKGSHLTTVPKNKETHRTICTEPLGNMALQLAAGMYIEGALHHCGIDLSDQSTKNRRLACLGSIDNSLATIDLKSASDYITPALIKALWPDEWYGLLDCIRSPSCKIGESSTFENLHMMSTMGNGFTFPMMTLTLLSLIYAFNAKNEIGRVNFVDMNKHAVFGDDIICPTSSYVGICEVLESAGLRINYAKSYFIGPFRESCGGDYFNGGFITPFYVESLTCESEIYVAVNKVLSWSSYHRIPMGRCLKTLSNMLHKKPLLVPEWCSPDSGVQTQDAPHRFRQLVPVKTHTEHSQSEWTMICALGGYLEARDDGTMYYTRREDPSHPKRYMVEKATFPKSYVDASDPSLRDSKQSRYVSRLVTLFIH